MNKVVSRLCSFFIGIPLVIGLIFFEQFNHIAIHITITVISFIAAAELFHIFAQNFNLRYKWLVVFLTGLIHIAMLLRAVFEFNLEYVTDVYVFGVLFLFAWEVFSKTEFEDSNAQLVSSAAVLTYAGFMFTFLSRMTFFENSKIVLILFLLMVFMCDSLAWFFGVLFGKNNKGIIKASPNKSIAGFAGGFAGSIASGLLCYFWQREVFAGSPWKIILLGFTTALTAIIGDLVESVLKRSSNCKDSGSVIPGRGGILDSIDSIIFSAPVFYILIKILYPNI